MHTKIKKDVLAIFSLLLKQQFPQFTRFKAGLPRRTTFARQIGDRLTLLIVITWESYENKFTVEVGWTFEATLDDVCSCFDAEGALKESAALLRLSVFTDKSDIWWKCTYNRNDDQGADLETRCRNSPNFAVVSEAFDLLRTAGMRYLDLVRKTKLPDCNE